MPESFKPCPWCNTIDGLLIKGESHQGPAYMGCKTCGCRGPEARSNRDYPDDHNEAFRLWQKREAEG